MKRINGHVIELRERINMVFKGSTMWDAEGSWFNKETEEVEVEPVKLIELAHERMCRPDAERFAKAVSDCGQKAKLWKTDGLRPSFLISVSI